jgi:uncharacterized protein YyaL (SSP411 family)
LKLSTAQISLSLALSLALVLPLTRGISLPFSSRPGSIGHNTACQSAALAVEAGDKAALTWLDFDSQVFVQAKKENKLILLDLEAVWCHWCHVMAEETYQDADVVKLLKSKYLCVRVDQDARPDLSNKYEQYGWPATIVFDAEGHELLKHAGYINPADMKRMLKEIASASAASTRSSRAASAPAVVSKADDHSQGDWKAGFSGLLPAVKECLVKKHKDGYDTKCGVWGNNQTFLDFDSAEYAMARGLAGDKQEAEQVRGALDGELNLVDPAFGGLYQYSTGGDWHHPHFEKVMAIQSDGLRLYSQGYLVYKEARYLQAARDIGRFFADFLTSPEGAFYTSQDADLKPGEHSGEYFALTREERLKLGQPHVDKHIYSRDNGQAANALTYLYRATGERDYLDRAIKAVTWIEAHRTIKESPGGFSHDAVDKAGPYLGDTLAMGRAYLSLYEVTADRAWLKKARLCSEFISRHFQADGQPGFVTAQAGQNGSGEPSASSSDGHGQLTVLTPQPLLDENVMLSRFANLLFQYTGIASYQEQAQRALRFLAMPEVVNSRRIFVAGILLANDENHTSPLHVTVVGGKSDADAGHLFAEAIKLPAIYKRVEWFDKAEGPLPNSDTDLPDLPRAAAFSCSDGRCSRPAYSADELLKMVARLAVSNQL